MSVGLRGRAQHYPSGGFAENVPDDKRRDSLAGKLETLSLPAPAKGVASPLQSAISGKSYVVETNGKKLSGSLKFQGDKCVAAFEDERGSYTIPFGAGAWAFSETMRLGGFGTVKDDPRKTRLGAFLRRFQSVVHFPIRSAVPAIPCGERLFPR